ncbi:MAG TPA: SDR family NAD(P)-dependent oxidoreductase [Chlorobaculum sp.]|uniref:Oxidoreductase, short chain dehydrogenase/reductase family n=1 Tax=Chlorobaculum tepidum (strain ATCC 49652 / DSM 12025 / NBRC 103806 / TLS) TaxID=194439 RepID=Q8KDB1_CHLTE|nr:SDR family oxidoreductase [Chlorobaculum tepidum]AAM72376.1 oxidoreductase, short chain dehydrogenase/reductase family [Chlorobaculum tepidum TLS]HBU23984.1 SDR family NAD(P)-dependent oxidoreductase [Chlorobaculum sp.]
MRKSLGVVITGGSAGLGLAMAREFLRAGDRVVICSRRESNLKSALQMLGSDVPDRNVYGMVCDVSLPAQAADFAAFAAAKLGIIDRWINNAGTAGRKRRPLWELDLSDIDETCRTNLSGSMMLCAEALRVMLRQPASADEPLYHLFNMGFSSAGLRSSPTSVPHRASKRAVAIMSKLLRQELEAAGIRSVGIHELSPGLVLTDLLLRDATPAQKRFFNAMAETSETVAATLVPAIRAITGRGSTLRYQPVLFMFAKLAASAFGYRKERFFDSEGKPWG